MRDVSTCSSSRPYHIVKNRHWDGMQFMQYYARIGNLKDPLCRCCSRSLPGLLPYHDHRGAGAPGLDSGRRAPRELFFEQPASCGKFQPIFKNVLESPFYYAIALHWNSQPVKNSKVRKMTAVTNFDFGWTRLSSG